MSSKCCNPQVLPSFECGCSDDDRGTVTVEYVVILTTLGLGCALATAYLGQPLLSAFLGQKDWLLLPFP